MNRELHLAIVDDEPVNLILLEEIAKAMGIAPQDAVMIGDDIDSDVLGAQEAGLRAILVKTGKFVATDLERGIVPDALADSIAQAETML